jgi:hypothetical protein
MFSKRGTVIIFLSVLFLPFILSSLNIPELFVKKTNTENRSLAKAPEININVLDGYPSKYSDYYNDQFPFRDALVEAYSYIKTRCFYESPIPDKVSIGKENWLYYVEDEVKLYNGSRRLSDSSLNLYLNEFTRREKYLEKRNCSMYIYIVPAKLIVYPEYFGKDIKRYNKQSEGEQLAEYIQKHSDVHITYLLSTLLKVKNADNPLLYYKTDTHWSDYGSFIGYTEIMRQVSSTCSNLKILTEKDMVTSDTDFNCGNLSVMMHAQNYFIEKRHSLNLKKTLAVNAPNQNYPPPENFPTPWQFQRNTPDTTLARALIIGDSFMIAAMKFLVESFSHTTLIFDAWRYKLNENIVEKEKPNVVIYILWEPKLENIIKKQI